MKTILTTLLCLAWLGLCAQTAQEKYQQAYTAITQRQYPEALRLVEEALALQPDFADAWNRKAFCLISLNRPEEAVTAATQALTLAPDMVKANANRGTAYYALERYAEAAADFQVVWSHNPEMADANMTERYAYSLLRTGKYREALPIWDLAIQKDPQDPINWLNRGTCREKTGQKDLALQDYDECLRLSPDQGFAHMKKGSLLSNQQQYAAAVVHLERALQLGQSSVAIHLDLGDAYYHLQQYDKAEASLTRYLSTDQSSAFAWNMRGVIRLQHKQWELALADLNQAVRLDAKEPRFLNNRGYAQFNLGRYEAAIADYDAALPLYAPNDLPHFQYKTEALRLLGQQGGLSAEMTISLAQEQAQADQFDAAMATLAQGIASYPNEAKLYYTRYTLRRKAVKDFATRAQDLEKAVSLAPQVPDYHYWLGEEYFLGQRNDDAIREYDRCMALGGQHLPATNPRGLGNGNYKQVILNQRQGGSTVNTYSPSTPASPGGKVELTAENRALYLQTMRQLGQEFAQGIVKQGGTVLEMAEVTDYKRVTGATLEPNQFIYLFVLFPNGGEVRVTKNDGTTCTSYNRPAGSLIATLDCETGNTHPVREFLSFTLERGVHTDSVFFVLVKGGK
ncbi:MAG: tetratricopeptide repeat protein [Bacteroidia bacterium]|nr:tetratricopeptide repeat protein [Bacteroidia bacterium]